MPAHENGNEAELEALEAFVVDPDLERLEELSGQFNLFEAIGATRMEVRHSDFLAFLLDPSQSHGLGDFFLKRLLQKILAGPGRGTEGITPIHLDLMDLGNTSVRREWAHTDILCVNEGNRLVVLIENKIDSGEGEGQLAKYLHEVERAYPRSAAFKTIPLYLTPDGVAPADDESPYVPVDYSLVCKTLDELLETRKSVMGADVVTTINHYVTMLRRRIVSDSEIEILAKKIYEKHRPALELIYLQRPDEQSEWSKRFQDLVKAEDQLDLDHFVRPRIRFVPKEWDAIKPTTLGCS
jgi:hypothetical protein